MLYFIPTPIWNKDDITIRALNLLRELKIFLCEDTRTTKKLFNLYEIDYHDRQLLSLTSFTSKWKLDYYMDLINKNDIWVISEAWTPWLSDPWKEIVRLCWENNVKFEVIPWANALIPAVVWSWFDTSEFVYLWFLPKKKWRQTKMKEILWYDMPVYIYESVHRIEKTLKEMKSLWFNWKVAIFRELSKKFEQKECDNIDTILSMLSKWNIKLKWEFVIWFSNER